MIRSDYESINALNWSKLKHILTAPAEFKFQLENPFTQTPAMLLGEALHCIVFEPLFFDTRYAVKPEDINRRTKAGKDQYACWEADLGGRKILTKEQSDTASFMAQILQHDPYTNDTLYDSPGQNEIVMQGEIDGVPMKGIADRIITPLEGNRLIDLKTTSSSIANDGAMSRIVANFQYHCQLWLYSELAKQNGHQIDQVEIIFQPTKGSHLPNNFVFNQPTLDEGERLVRKAIAIHKACTEANLWPGLAKDKEPSGLPTWAIPVDEE